MSETPEADLVFEQIKQASAQFGALRVHQAIAGGSGNLPPIDEGRRWGDNDGMEARLAKLETTVEYIQRDVGAIKSEIVGLRSDARVDFRLLFGALIFSNLGLAGLMAKGFGWL